jgi:hypothetical protein
MFPETYTVPPAFTACEYGPNGMGAFVVVMISLFIVSVNAALTKSMQRRISDRNSILDKRF